ncbi:hypothetical protein GUJ93_ZPchr0013g34629 [Zizania palustris]|uniref:Uncharacterized protein n=1 Tax=Zizania palustris TaxID=103762 RepID=A0A8J6BWZ2_ZIZPA|nr:hypothetical protein GUJ93_ZPchr0013g34629 [Zizania palustris]
MESPDRVEPVDSGPHPARHGTTPAASPRIKLRWPGSAPTTCGGEESSDEERSALAITLWVRRTEGFRI